MAQNKKVNIQDLDQNLSPDEEANVQGGALNAYLTHEQSSIGGVSGVPLKTGEQQQSESKTTPIKRSPQIGGWGDVGDQK